MTKRCRQLLSLKSGRVPSDMSPIQGLWGGRIVTQGGALLCPGLRNGGPLGLKPATNRAVISSVAFGWFRSRLVESVASVRLRSLGERRASVDETDGTNGTDGQFLLDEVAGLRQVLGARAHGMWTYEPRQGRNAATAVCSASAVVTLAFQFTICGLRFTNRRCRSGTSMGRVAQMEKKGKAVVVGRTSFVNSWMILDFHAAAAETARTPSFGQHAQCTVPDLHSPGKWPEAAQELTGAGCFRGWSGMNAALPKRGPCWFTI